MNLCSPSFIHPKTQELFKDLEESRIDKIAFVAAVLDQIETNEVRSFFSFCDNITLFFFFTPATHQTVSEAFKQQLRRPSEIISGCVDILLERPKLVQNQVLFCLFLCFCFCFCFCFVFF